MKKCILLVRVSTSRQTLDAQREELIVYASQFGYKREDMELIEDKESAIRLSEEERNGLNRLKECVETGDYDCVFVWEPSRIARKRKVLYSITDYLTERKIQLRVFKPTINLLDDKTKTPDSTASLAFALYAEMAEAEMRTKADRFARAKNDAFERGKYMGGKMTTGYTVDESGFWVIDPESAQLVKLAFQLYNTGDYSMTGLAKELKSRGYYSHISVTTAKNEIYCILRNPIYVGQRTSKNIYPAIIDKDTWESCAQRRKENKQQPRNRHKHLLMTLIRCSCGASYSVNKIDGSYVCRVKHNAVEKGLMHSPSIHVGMIESIAWYVALTELSADIAIGKTDAKEKLQKEIEVLRQKATFSEKLIKDILQRKSDLDKRYFVDATIGKEQYDSFSLKQEEKIKEERSHLRAYKSEIEKLETKIQESRTFNSMLDELAKNFEALKNGTDFQVMHQIIHQYITEIRIEAMEGKLTSFWKKVTIKTIHDEENKKKMEELKARGFNEAAECLSNVFYVDCHHHIVYWGENMTNIVPCVYINRLPRKRIDQRKGRKRNPTKQHQY